MLDGRTIVFVEVKTRQTQHAGHPSEFVDEAKQRRLSRLAVTFLKRHWLLERPARFDVVAVTWPDGRGKPEIEHFPTAFDAVGEWEFYPEQGHGWRNGKPGRAAWREPSPHLYPRLRLC